MSKLTICIKPQEFNESLIEIMEPSVYKPKASNIKITTSDILYRNNDGKLCNLYIALPSVEAYGPSPIYNFNSKMKTKENIQGYSISYSHSDVEKMFESLMKTCQDKINEFAKSKLIKKCILKPTFNYKNNSEDKTKVAYFKLNTIRDSESDVVKILTKMSSTSNEPLNLIDTVSKYGLLTPMIHISKIYFGPHGNSEYGASIQIKVVRLRFSQKTTSVPDFPSSDEEEQDEEYN